jgi:hypothetical protein
MKFWSKTKDKRIEAYENVMVSTPNRLSVAYNGWSWNVEFQVYGGMTRHLGSFKSKKDASSFAKKWMMTHPRAIFDN